jgi:hypothetical protein
LQERANLQQRQQLMGMEISRQKADQEAQALQRTRLEAWRQGLTPPQGAAVNLPGVQARNATQADSAMGTPGYGASSATDRQVSMPLTARQQGAYELAKAGEMGPAEWFKFNNPEPVKLGKDESLLDPTQGYKPIASNVGPDPHVREVQGLIQARDQFPLGHPTRAIFQAAIDKATSHQPAANIKIDNKMGEGLAKEVGPIVKESYDAARGGQQAIRTSDALIKAVDSNKILTGPGATIRLKGAQIAQSWGFSGKDDAEIISNTRAAIQGLAQSTLASRASLKGQGAVSDFEGKLIEKAASGEINDMTPAEIKQVAIVNKRLAQQLIDNHSQMTAKLKGDKATAPIANMFELPTQGREVNFGDLN